MKPLLCALGSLLLAATAHAQWTSTSYTLKGGWSSIYLTGDAKQDTLANLFPSEVLEIWRWNPNPNQVGFLMSPRVPAASTPEWSVWKRDGSVTQFTSLSGQTAYLGKIWHRREHLHRHPQAVAATAGKLVRVIERFLVETIQHQVTAVHPRESPAMARAS